MNNHIFTLIKSGWALALRNIQRQIIEHKLGYAWTLITPVLYAICYLLIKQSLNTSDANTLHHAFNAFIGMLLLQLWIQLVQEMADLVRRNRGMLRGLSISIEPFVLAALFEGGISLIIRFTIIFSALVLMDMQLPINLFAWLWILLSGCVIILSSAALGIVLAPWASLYGDVRKAIRALTMPIALISPIFYPAVRSTDSPLFVINQINPLASPLAVIADVLNGRTSIYTDTLLGWLFLSLVLLAWGGRLMHRQVPVLLERLGS